MPSPEPKAPKPITKRVSKHVSTAFDIANATIKILRYTKQIEFSLVKIGFRGPEHTMTHTLDLTDDELEHLDNGGTIIAAHICGWQPHIKIPRSR
jgi:hypothetical protein